MRFFPCVLCSRLDLVAASVSAGHVGDGVRYLARRLRRLCVTRPETVLCCALDATDEAACREFT